jgi:hypothetical protein
MRREDSQNHLVVIQTPKREFCMARYELSDFEWNVIKSLPPNKPRAQRHLLGIARGISLGGSP